MSVKKSIKEMNAAAGGGVQIGNSMDFFRERRNRKPKHKGAPFTEPVQEQSKTVKVAQSGVVVTGKGKNKKLKPVKFENKSESMLREAIRNLIFLNRVKYHEENVKRELQEQKLRKVIRFLLTEGDDALESALDTTGQTAAFKFLQKVETTTFKNYFSNLKTSRKQRREFKKMYLTGVKLYLDALDQQYYILNPSATRAASAPVGMPSAPPPNAAAAPAAVPAPLAEAEQPVNPVASPVANQIQSDTGGMQQQAISAAVSPNVAAIDDETIKAAVENAKEALKADLAQIDNLYFNLSFKEFTTNTGRTTSDRKDFRLFLIGDQNTVGNLQIKFKQYNANNPIKNNLPDDIPDDDAQVAGPLLDVPNEPGSPAPMANQPPTSAPPQQAGEESAPEELPV